MADTRGTPRWGPRRSTFYWEGKKETVLSRAAPWNEQVRICIERLKFRVLADAPLNCFPFGDRGRLRSPGPCGNPLYDFACLARGPLARDHSGALVYCFMPPRLLVVAGNAFEDTI